MRTDERHQASEPAHTVSLSDFVDAYRNSLGRLGHFGLRVAGTRLAGYERLLSRTIEQERNGDEVHQGTVPFLLALSEASEIIDIASLSDEYFDSEARFRLRKISGGPMYVEPGVADQARDYALEFLVGASLQTQGKFGGFSRLGGDVTFGVSRMPIECKRISSIRRLEARLREGRRQVERLVDLGSPPGVILVDVTSPVFSRFGVVGAVDDAELQLAVERRLASFMLRYVMNDKHLSALSNEAVLGVVVRYLGIGTAGEVSSVRRSAAWQSWSLHPNGSKENDVFIDLLAGLGPGTVETGTLEEMRAAVEAAPLD